MNSRQSRSQENEDAQYYALRARLLESQGQYLAAAKFYRAAIDRIPAGDLRREQLQAIVRHLEQPMPNGNGHGSSSPAGLAGQPWMARFTGRSAPSGDAAHSVPADDATVPSVWLWISAALLLVAIAGFVLLLAIVILQTSGAVLGTFYT